MPLKDPALRKAYNARRYAANREAIQAQHHAYYVANRELLDEQHRAYEKRTRNLANRKLLARAVADGELARGCADCGEKDLRVLEFDHVRGVKRWDVSLMVANGYAPRALYAEIDKCEIRCANDHRRITAERRTLAVAA